MDATKAAAINGVGYAVLIALASATVVAGIYPEPLIRISDRIAFELIHPAGYIDSVFIPPQ